MICGQIQNYQDIRTGLQFHATQKMDFTKWTYISGSFIDWGIGNVSFSTFSPKKFNISLSVFPWNKIYWSFPIVYIFKMSSSSISSSLKRESPDKIFFSSNSSIFKTIFSSTNSSLGGISFKVDSTWINSSFDMGVNFSSIEEMDLWGIGLTYDVEALSWKILDLLKSVSR